MYKQFGFLVIILTIVFISGCAKKEPDFVGYIFAKDDNRTVIVGTTDQEPPLVLIKEGKNKLDIGSKVEVRYKEDAIDSTFPSQAPASLSEIDIPEPAKKILKYLFEDMFEKNGENYYPIILNVEEKPDEWVVTTKEFYSRREGDTFQKATYMISKTNLKITVS